jgi:hypothetical protein
VTTIGYVRYETQNKLSSQAVLHDIFNSWPLASCSWPIRCPKHHIPMLFKPFSRVQLSLYRTYAYHSVPQILIFLMDYVTMCYEHTTTIKTLYVEHNYFIVCEATCFDLLCGHHQAFLMNQVTKCYVHVGIPLCSQR